MAVPSFDSENSGKALTFTCRTGREECLRYWCQMLDWLKQIARSRYVALLEEEVARERAETERLRAENRALMNSLLGTAGFPPLEFPETPKPQPLPRLRKRSWHQIQACREAEAGAGSNGATK